VTRFYATGFTGRQRAERTDTAASVEATVDSPHRRVPERPGLGWTRPAWWPSRREHRHADEAPPVVHGPNRGIMSICL